MNTLPNFDVTFRSVEAICEFWKEMDYSIPNLNEPSNLTGVLLCSNWREQKYRLVDFTGTTIGQAIEKILVFYKHKTYRRMIGDHTFFEGFEMTEEGYAKIWLGS